MHKLDFHRALVTDTIPGDIPIIVSNDGFWSIMKERAISGLAIDDVADRILQKPRSYTRPYRYSILRENGTARGLSLLHPASQLEVVEFYKKYEHLICYFCRKSPASIRSPRKVASTFFVRGSASEINRLRRDSIDTVQMETAVANPASYFAYTGFNRAYKFFGSRDFIRLEKTYSVMHLADVAKCFNSIYTHTAPWAVTNVDLAKDHTKSEMFGNRFDRLMQKMNFNETNGICIGPEISRVFAEIILSEIDRRTIKRLIARGVSYGHDYEFRRYVDDFYIFSKDEGTSNRVVAALSSSLSEFNLHLNASKSEKISRPFITSKTRATRDISKHIEEFFEKFLTTGTVDGRQILFPKSIRNKTNLFRSLLDAIKTTCFDHKGGYDLVSNYTIGALCDRLSSLASDIQFGLQITDVTEKDYLDSLTLLLEAIYFFYSASPSVPSSLRVSQSALEAAGAIFDHASQYYASIVEQIIKWTFEFLKIVNIGTNHADADCVAIEVLNILLVLGELAQTEKIAQLTISEVCALAVNPNYFEIVTLIFCMKDSDFFKRHRSILFERAKTIILSGYGVEVDSQAAHLALDILSCPHIPQGDRLKLYKELRSKLDLPVVGKAEGLAAIQKYQSQTWFVNWRRPNLLRMIRKKELSSVY